MRKVEREELERGDGVDGRPALVAVEGRVYDVSASKLWAKGHHMNTHGAGRDLSREILAAPHGRDVLEQVTLVGELVEPGPPARAPDFPRPPGLVARVLAFHPHPITVHFPIALSLTAALFLLLSIVLGARALERAALYNLALVALAAPVAAASGLLSWRYNYAGIWTPIFRRKAILSGVLAVLSYGALLLRLRWRAAFGFEGPWQWLYVLAILALGGTVLGLGYLGGRITFPRRGEGGKNG